MNIYISMIEIDFWNWKYEYDEVIYIELDIFACEMKSWKWEISDFLYKFIKLKKFDKYYIKYHFKIEIILIIWYSWDDLNENIQYKW